MKVFNQIHTCQIGYFKILKKDQLKWQEKSLIFRMRWLSITFHIMAILEEIVVEVKSRNFMKHLSVVENIMKKLLCLKIWFIIWHLEST